MYRMKLAASGKRVLAGTLLAACFVFPVQAQGVRMVFVNTPEVLKEAPQAQEARDRLKTEFAPRDEKLASSGSALKELEEKLERDGAIMSESERRKVERDIVSARRELKRSREEFNEDFNIRRNEEFSKLQRKVAKAITDLAKENGYDLVLEAGVVYASDKVDITESVVERLNN